MNDIEMKKKLDELKEGENMEMQRNLDYVETEKEKTLADSLGEYASDNSIELSEKITKKEEFENHATDLSKLFIRCFKDFRNKFRYCTEAQDTIMKLDVVCSVLIGWIMEYNGGMELGDHIALQNIKNIVQVNYFAIDEFLKLYAEVKEEGSSKIEDALKELTNDGGEHGKEST